MNSIILARGGSKGVPGKNIRLLNGKPLLSYPILAAQKTNNINKIYVSTDSEEIANVAKKYDAYIIERPSHLAQDKSLDVDAFRHAIEHLQDYSDIVQLRATTPIIDSATLDSAIEYFNNNNDCTSLRSAHEFSESVFKFFKQEDKYWTGFFPNLEGEYYNFPRQNFPKSYLPNGYIDIVRPKIFMNNATFHGNKILSFITPHTIEVDTLEDFLRLEQRYKNV
jgi:CMP-N-acetylneuraminic acid synthetase